MPKKRVEKPQREFTRRQLSRWQQQRRRQRIVFGLSVIIVVAVLGIIGAGWYISYYQPLHQTVIKVNDTEFSMNYYIKMLRAYGGGQQSNPLLAQVIANSVETTITQNELIRQAAAKPPINISISDDAVVDEIKSRDLPLTKEYRDMVRAEMLVNKLRDEYFEQQVPLSAEQRHVMTMFLESEAQAIEARARLEGGEEFTEVAGELSLEDFSKSVKGDLDWHPKDSLAILLDSSIPAEYAFNAETGVLSQPIYDEAKIKQVGYWLIRIMERKKDSDEVRLRAMLLGTEEQACEVRARVEAGEFFDNLAKEFSQLPSAKEDGGDVGWLTLGTVSPVFDEFAFNPEVEVGMVSQPIRDETRNTKGGYWLLKVVGIEDNKQIEEKDRDLLKSKALNDWVSTLKNNPENKVESYLDDAKKGWAIKQSI